MEIFKEILIENPIIAAVRNDDDIRLACASKSLIVFVLYGNVMSISGICKKLKASNKKVFVHIDMVDGLKGDLAGIEFIKRYAEPYGIITTKPTNVKHAKSLGMNTIQRIFIIDSLSLKTGVKNVLDVCPTAVEVMPGVASKIISNMQEKVHIPIIAGGLIQNKKDAVNSLAAGALAVSTTSHELWNM